MPTTIVSSLIGKGLPRSQASALRRKAERLGMSSEEYVRRLIAEDLELDAVARSKSFAELSAPFKKSLRGLSETELDRLARPSRRMSTR